MFNKLLRAVAATERTGHAALYAEATQQWVAGTLTDDECQEVYSRIEKARHSVFPIRRKRDRKRTTEKVRHHRRWLASSGPLPAHLAANFTTCELAVLAVLTLNGGKFDRSIKEMADRAKVGHSTVQKALRLAEKLGLIKIQERRVRGSRNLPNLVHVISLEWITWIKRGGSKKVKPLDTRLVNSCNSNENNPHNAPWKRLISRTSPGLYAIQSPQRR